MKKSYYQNIDSDLDLPKLEEKILKFWKEKNIFQKSIDIRDNSKDFIFYDGPPFANGLPHYGHLLTGFVKDTVARYQTTLGKKVERRFGWDCHGLPAEMSAEKELNISGRKQIVDYGVDKFNNHCKSSVMKYSKIWENYVDRQARWVDFKNDYKTMDITYMESVMWVFKQLYDKGLVYESKRVMPYSWACETPLSNFETRLDNSYRERADKSVTVKFTLDQIPDLLKGKASSVKILAWTTTPWTLPANLALAVNKELRYCYVIKGDECLIIAEDLFSKYKKELGEEISGIINASELIGLKYKPLFNYFAGHKNSFVILHGDFVTADEGTGVVHIAPGFGEDDQILCEKYSIEVVCPIDSAGRFTSEVTDFADVQVLDSIDDVIIKLKNDGSWLKTEQYIHNYPHCWRTDTPLIYRAISSWYVEVTKFKDRMVEINKEINWVPSHIKEGLFGKWLENARDWSISRNRFWGTPIPIWKSDNKDYPRIDVYGSIEELENDFGVKITDLHKPFIDNLTRPNPDDPTGKSKMVRIDEVFDCWFDSGSMPYGQAHYPFKNKDKFDANFPADFIVEYAAQTRGWFYTLLVISTALFDSPPFLNCICHGVILDEKGQKLSKRLNNYADPNDLFALYGADAMRYLMLSSPVLSGNELLIDKEGNMIREVLRISLKPIWNAYKFFTLYANSDGLEAKINYNSKNILDIYILSKLKNAVLAIKLHMDAYEISLACTEVNKFVELLNNWYIRRSRQRFWKSDIDDDKISAYDTLYTVLVNLTKAASSLLPMLMEEIYLGLTGNSDDNSVHLQNYPSLGEVKIDSDLIEKMDQIREICSSALSIRNSENIRIRQPLNKLSIYGVEEFGSQIFIDLMKDEINVKNVEFAEINEQVASRKLKIHFPVLGKRLSHKVKDIISAQKQNLWSINSDGKVMIADEILHQEEAELTFDIKNSKGYAILNSNNGIVGLDLNISEELRLEGTARDVVRFVQQARKDNHLDVADIIEMRIDADQEIIKALEMNLEYLNQQTLSRTSLGKIDKEYSYNRQGEIEGASISVSFSILR